MLVSQWPYRVRFERLGQYVSMTESGKVRSSSAVTLRYWRRREAAGRHKDVVVGAALDGDVNES